MLVRGRRGLRETFAFIAVCSMALTVAAEAELPDSITRYEIRRNSEIEHLEVVRTRSRIEHRYATRGMTEVWTRDDRGELEHWKAFHGPRRSVHYTPGDLRTVRSEPAWEQLATLIHPEERARLTQSKIKGAHVALTGTIDHQRTRVRWNSALGWAEEMVIGSREHNTRFRLLSTKPCAEDMCRPTDMATFREIEFADLGDAEHDEFVRSFLAQFARAHSH
ncbi:MAG: hypothetical protein RL701_5099 [Pseudomonadota bacterium]